jgi:hypothetical protein
LNLFVLSDNSVSHAVEKKGWQHHQKKDMDLSKKLVSDGRKIHSSEIEAELELLCAEGWFCVA